LTCVKISLVRLSDKVGSLHLAPFSEKVENHSFTLFCRPSWFRRKFWNLVV